MFERLIEILEDAKRKNRESTDRALAEMEKVTHMTNKELEEWRKQRQMREDIQKIAQHYGYEAQSRQCIEEMAELTQAINKYWRKDLQCGKYPYNPWDGYMPSCTKEYDNIVEEIADVSIMLEQMKFLFSCGKDVDCLVEQKIKRQLERIEAE